jgi:amidase
VPDGGLTSLTAQEAVRLLRGGDVSPIELIDAALERIEETDGALNALPTLCPERAHERARRLEAPDRPGPGWLAGLPIAVKDLEDVAGVRTTYGSPVYTDHVPDRSDFQVERLEANGAVVLAKANTSEFGAGANTYNEVFGETRNPWNTALTCGGSSGGSAASLAAGQIWLATGSDLGGSLRIPASFCSVVGLRPSPGRVACGPRERPFDTLAVEGPMGRTVGDVALMLDSMSGLDPRDPLSIEPPPESFQSAVASRLVPARVGYSPDLGVIPVDAEVGAICEAATRRFADLGADVERAWPDLSAAPPTIRTLRAAGFVADLAAVYESHRDRLKTEIVGNVEEGLALTPAEIGRAERARGALQQEISTFFQRYDLLACPAVCVPPFDVSIRWLREVNGVAFDHYVEWLRLTYAITLTSCPALSVPCGFTADGCPVGLQLVAPARGEAQLLAAAAALEEVLGLAGATPIDPRGGNL